MSFSNKKVVPKELLIPFILVTSLFALWGFANDITNPLVKAFTSVFEDLSNTQSSLIQVAFYGGYATMAIPAALFIQKYSYKAGILVGLGLYAIGALLFIPAATTMKFIWFPMSLYILTFGLAFLETTANPYILSMGDEETATQRLNLAQAFNPIGSLLGMFVATELVLANLSSTIFREKQYENNPNLLGMSPDDSNNAIEKLWQDAKELDPDGFLANQIADVEIIRNPYAILGIILIIMFLVFLFKKMPNAINNDKSINPKESAKRLFKNRRWKEGVIAQIFYVGAQITCWTYILHYSIENVSGMTITKAQYYNIVAMGLFLASRFVCTFLLKYFSPGKLLMNFSILAAILISFTITLQNYTGLLCLVGVSGCMSLMFPTIYGIALKGTGEDAKIASAGLVFAIVGGMLFPLIVGLIMDGNGFLFIKPESLAFVVPLVSFFVIALYGYRSHKASH